MKRIGEAADALEVEMHRLGGSRYCPGAPPGELLDDYVACQLEGASACLDMLKIVYESDTNSLSQQIVSALFAVVYWIEVARSDIAGWLRLQVA